MISQHFTSSSQKLEEESSLVFSYSSSKFAKNLYIQHLLHALLLSQVHN